MTDLHARIAVRAYFAWQAAGHPEGQHEAHWLAAEWAEIEVDALAAHAERMAAAEAAGKAKRSAAAKRGAATRKAKREAKRESESRVVAAILGRSAARGAAVGASAH